MSFLKPVFVTSLLSLLGSYKTFCDATLIQEWRGTTDLDKACLYVLQTGGKRMRPAIVWMMQEALGEVDWKKNASPGIACEYFHTASLIADDLPCMDNDDFRRGKPTAHKKFSESTALLASFALISEGFREIGTAPLPPGQDPEMHTLAIVESSRKMGIPGLLGGQLLDLQPPGADFESLMAIVDKKTGALFELCFVLGWIFGGGRKEKLDSVRKLAFFFGRAFQLVDDIDDYEQDLKAHKLNNSAVVFGLKEVSLKVQEYASLFQQELRKLGIDKSSLKGLADLLLMAVN